MLTAWQRATLVVVLGAWVSAATAESHLMRFADVHADTIVFTYEDDLWLASTAGGLARRLTHDPGTEAWAKFSPDGQWLAFSAQYDGNFDVYVMPATGGEPRRLTYHPSSDRVIDWWPDGKSVFFRARREYPFRGEMLYRVFVDTGLDEKVPVDRASLAALSPDGKRIAYTRIGRDAATWKRHRGGTADDLWLGSLDARDYKKVSDTDWTSDFPMWQGDAVYFRSDREDGTLNIYKYDVGGGQTTRITKYTDYDVKYPSLGPGLIIYQYAESLTLLDLKTGQTRPVPVEIPTDRVPVRPEYERISPSTGSFSLSPTGVRMLLEARGEIFNLPVKDGEPIELTDQTSGSREKNAAWSPDGRWIAFISDKTGEEEIWLVDQKGEKPWKQLTRNGLGFRMQLVWSPDSKYVAFSDKFMRLYVVDVQTEEAWVADQGEYDDAWERWGIQDYVWSPDSQWIAYTKMEATMYESIFLYSVADRKIQRVTSDMTQDWSPSFDPEGKYLYFLSNRSFSPIMGAVDQNHVFIDMAQPYVVLLVADAENPFLAKDSEEPTKEEKAADDAPATESVKRDAAAESDSKGDPPGDAKDESKKKVEVQRTKIDLDGLAERVLLAEGVTPGNYFRLEAVKGGFLYLAKTEPEFEKYQNVNDGTGGNLELHQYKLEVRETSKLMSGVANYHLSSDGKKLVYRAGSSYGVVDAGSKSSVGDGKVDYGDVRLLVDRPAEFQQMFNEAWRIERDWFYDPHMNGLDWPAMREKYGKFVPFCGDRSDLNYLIGEMISELNIGHTYVSGGDTGRGGRNVSTGLLGADFLAEPGVKYYKIAHIIPRCLLTLEERSPLAEPGCPIREGHYLIAIDGEEVTTAGSVYAHLQNRVDRVVTLTYNDQPTPDGAKTCRVKTIGSESGIRYREWVESRRAYVDKLTGGKVGYVHLPDMMQGGLIEFARYFYPQYNKAALIIDARYNGGGFTGDMVIDRLERKIWGITQPREGGAWRDPECVFVGPWAVLINEDTGSNGEMFAEAIKIKKMAPLIGMRTWGGSIGIEPHQNLVDGGSVTPPQFGLYGLNSKYLIEGRGVEPDIEVDNMPGEVLRGVDTQLEAAVKNVLERLAAEGFKAPPPPPFPDKSRPHGS